MFSFKPVQAVAALLATSAAPGVLAAPTVPADVEAVPLANLCSSYPGYDASTQQAGPWTVKLVNSGNASIEGFSDTSEYSLGSSGVRWGYITFPSSNGVAKTQLRCANNTLQGYVPVGVGGVEWRDLQLSPYPYDATLIYNVQGDAAKPYAHYINGKQQPGVFLGGYDNSTTWGVKYYPKGSGATGDDYFYIRLLGPNSADPNTGEPLQEGEFTAFIQVNA